MSETPGQRLRRLWERHGRSGGDWEALAAEFLAGDDLAEPPARPDRERIAALEDEAAKLWALTASLEARVARLEGRA